MCYAKIFSQCVACLFFLLTVFFTEWKFLILMTSNLSIFSFMDCAFGVVSIESLPNPKLPRFYPVLSSRSFIVLHFTFRAMIHFKLIFMKGIKFMSRFMFLHVVVQLLQHQFLKSLVFLH